MAQRELIDALGRLEPVPYTAVVYRQLAVGYQALSGEGARAHGGRWNPPDSFPVLYTSPSPAVVRAEIVRAAKRKGFAPEDLLPRRLVSYRVDLQRVVDLTSEVNRHRVGFSLVVITDDDIRICQAIGEAAHYMGFEGIAAPSAAAEGDSLSIFLNRLLPGSSVTAEEEELIEKLG